MDQIPKTFAFFAGSSNPAFARCDRCLSGRRSATRFARVTTAMTACTCSWAPTVRSRKVFIVQSFCPPVNEHLVELLMMVRRRPHRRRQRGARRHPLFLLRALRQEGRAAHQHCRAADGPADPKPPAPPTVMTMSLHSPQVHGFFDVPTDPLTARPVFEDHFRHIDLAEAIVISPDAGRVHTCFALCAAAGAAAGGGQQDPHF